MKKFNYLTCSKCKRVYFGVSLEYAEKEIMEFNTYYDGLSKEDQKKYYGGKKSHLINYLFCQLCESLFTKMKKSKKNELPNGSTINPILDPKQDGRK